ncbi:hypothetical protein [Singulisphaera sp. PoT]|uniref:hypothetical protein n=1 Tax=Singulisphaera sp. PoT TaxID=3411797 RepID=UPI003BF4617A
MGRPRPTKHSKFEEAESPKASISKAEAVRRAVAAGKGAPGDGVAFIKDEYGIEMDNKTFSLNKAQQKSREAKREATGKGAPAPQVVPGTPIEGILTPPKLTPGADGTLIDVLEQMKPLIAQYGADQVKRIVDLLG